MPVGQTFGHERPYIRRAVEREILVLVHMLFLKAMRAYLVAVRLLAPPKNAACAHFDVSLN
jgi:hypothetical protein